MVTNYWPNDKRYSLKEVFEIPLFITTPTCAKASEGRPIPLLTTEGDISEVFQRSLITCLSLFFLFSLLNPAEANAQYLEEGVRNYKQQNYEEALLIFTEIDSPKASLFAGKSYYALRRYDDAERVLNNTLNSAPPRIYYEAAYTSALVDFQQKQFADALSKLYQVFQNSSAESLAENAELLYTQILNYLTARQRTSAIEKVSSDQIKYQLVEYALGKISFQSVNQIISSFYSSADEGQWVQKMEDLESSLSNAPAYRIEYGDEYNALVPPDGTIYNIGIALPSYNPEAPEFPIVQGLFLGAKMAVDEFNNNHSDSKTYLSFLPTGSTDLDEIVEKFSEGSYGDIIIGPLFSEQAESMIELSAEYNIPVIAPLANANFETTGSLFYQSNPTFPVHGKMMARFAMKNLNMNRFAVIAGQNSQGQMSAEAFKNEVEGMGGEIVYYTIEDLQSNNYDISPFTQYYGSKTDPIDAVYAPFTGDRSLYLVRQLAENINTMSDPIPLLGSQKWGDVNFVSDVYSRSDVFFSQSGYRDNRSGRLSNFQNQFRQQMGFASNRFAAIGYDVTKYLLEILDQIGNPALLTSAMQESPRYRGLIKDIHFSGTHVNQAVQIYKVNSNGNLILQSWR